MQDLYKQVLHTVKKPLLVFFLILILISPLITAQEYIENYNDPISYSMGDLRWCRLIGCTIADLIVDSLTVYNLSVIGQVFNVTMIRVNWTITDFFNVGGNLEAKNITSNCLTLSDGTKFCNSYSAGLWENSTGEAKLKSSQNIDMQEGDIKIRDSDGEFHNISRDLQIADEMSRNITLTGLNGTLDLETSNLTITTLTGENIVVNIDKNETILDRSLDSIILTSGTNESPILNQIVYSDSANPVLSKRTTITLKSPAVATFLQGANYTYASAIGLATTDNLIGGIFNRFYRDGSTYRSGFEINVSTNMVNISTGVINFLFDEIKITSNHSTSNLHAHVHEDGSFHQHFTIDDDDSYNEGSAVSNNKFFNAVFGITLTHDGEGVMYTVTQDLPSTEYTKAIDAEIDIEDTINFFPSNDLISLAYIPVVRVVIRRSGGVNTIQTLSNGLLFDDLRGTITKTSSSPPPSGITSHPDLTNLGWSVAGHTIDTDVDGGGYTIYDVNANTTNINVEGTATLENITSPDGMVEIISNITTEFINSLKIRIEEDGSTITEYHDVNCSGTNCVSFNLISFVTNLTEFNFGDGGYFYTNESALKINQTLQADNFTYSDGTSLNKTIENKITDLNESVKEFVYNRTFQFRLNNGTNITIICDGEQCYLGYNGTDKDTDTNASTACVTGADVLLGDGTCGGHNDLTDYVSTRHIDWTNAATGFKTSSTAQIGGKAIVGYSAIAPPSTFAIYGSSSEIASGGLYAWSTIATEYPQWIGYRSNSNTVGTMTETVDGQYHLGFWAKGVRSIGGVDWGNSGAALWVQDGTCGAARCPARLVLGVYSTAGDLFYWHIKPDGTIRTTSNVTIGSDTVPDAIFEVEGWDKSGLGVTALFEKNVSAEDYLQHSSSYDKSRGNALDWIFDSDYYIDNGELNHSKSYSYAGEMEVKDRDKPVYVNETICSSPDDCDIITKVTYPFKKNQSHISLGKEKDKLEQAIYELKEQSCDERLTILEDCITNSKDFIELKECIK